MKPIKPRKLTKTLEKRLRAVAKIPARDAGLPFRPREAEQILAALEYERQRAAEARKAPAVIRDHGGSLRGEWARSLAEKSLK